MRTRVKLHGVQPHPAHSGAGIGSSEKRCDARWMDGWMECFSSAYLRILISLVAMDLDANQHQRRDSPPPPQLYQLQPGGTFNPSHPTTFPPGGKHLPLCCVHIMTSNHYGAVMSWALSVAASLELPLSSGPLVLFRLPASPPVCSE